MSTPTESWSIALREEVRVVWNLELRALSPPQRVVVARWFAHEFSNCRKSETKNRNSGAKAAAAFAKMAEAKKWRDFTVGDYFSVAREHHKVARNEGPWYDPFEARAMLEASNA